MLNIEELHANIQYQMNNIEGDDAVEEVEINYVVYDKNMKDLLATENVEDYISKYDEICESNKGLLECFETQSAQELKTYIEENAITFDALKVQTVLATCEALKDIIYEAEEDDY